jgi:hypothetical protein
MPFRKLQLRPGVNLEQSPTLNQAQLAQSNLIRFYGGLVQKIGGWQALSSNTFTGTARALHGWADITGNPYLAIGTDQFLQVLVGGSLFNITPNIVVEVTNEPPSFVTTVGSPLVTVTDTSYSPDAGDWIDITTQVAIGGLILFGLYQIVSVSAPTYVINAGENATATATLLYNDNGVLVVDPAAGWPTAAGSMAAGSFYSNGGVCSIVPGGTYVSSPAVYFGSITASALLTLGGNTLPTTEPTAGTLQIWNNHGECWVA